MHLHTLTRRQAIAAIAGVFGSAALVPFSGTSAATKPVQPSTIPRETAASSYCPESEEQAFLGLINKYRQANGLSGLKLSRTLGAAAEHHSQDMARNDYFSHTLSSGQSWSTNIKKHGYTASSSMAENIAAGHRTAADTFEQWRNSAPHNRNMLSSNYRAIGIGRASNSGSTYRYYWTTTFGGRFDAGPGC